MRASISKQKDSDRPELFPHVTSMAAHWDERLKGQFPMALTKDVTEGKVTASGYNLAQGQFIRASLTYIQEEIQSLKHLGGQIADFGIGEGTMLSMAKFAHHNSFGYEVWDFSETARNIGRQKLNSMFPGFNALDWVKSGSLQSLFGNDEAAHSADGFTVGVFSRILQHNPEDIQMILSNMPMQVHPEGKIIVITVFEDDNKHVEHDSSFWLPKKSDFMDMVNAKTSSHNRLSIVSERSGIVVDSEKYTALTLSSTK